jgi:putative oxidoreductase
MDIALLVLRVVVGLFFAGHGAQKLFGMFGGHGLAGTGGFFESLGLTPGRRHATAAGAAELAGGVLLVLGLATPLAALLIIAVMTTAILTVHAKNGPWVTDGGFEYNVVLIAAAFCVAGAGPGDISLDDAFGWAPDITGTGWALLVLAVGILGGIAAKLSGRTASRRTPATPATPATATAGTRTAAVDPEADRRFATDRDDDRVQAERPGIPADPR